MTTYNWTPGVSADWSSSVDWSPFGVPSTLTDDAVIAASGTYTVTIGSTESYAIDSLTFNPGGGGTLAVAGILTLGGVSAEVTQSSGLVTVTGTLSASSLTLNGGTFQADSGGKETLSIVSNTSGTFGLHNGATAIITGGFTNSGTLDVDTGYQYYDYSPAYTEGGSGLTIGGTLDNTGVVQVGDTSQALGAATTVTLGGLVNVSGASFSVYGSASYTAMLSFSNGGAGFTENDGTFLLYHAGLLTLPGSFTNTGTFGIHNDSTLGIGGGFSNSGTLDVDSGYQYYDYSPAYTEGGSSLTITGTLNNTGVVLIGDTSQGLGAATTVTLGGLVNVSGASFSVYGSASYTAMLSFSNGGAGFTENDGTFLLYHAGLLTLPGSFTNTGTFGIHNDSTLGIGGGFSNSGTLDVDSGYQYYDYSPAYTEGGSSLTITGTLNNTGVVLIGDTSQGLGAATTVTLGGLVNVSGASFSVYGSASYTAMLSFSNGGAGFTENDGTFLLYHAGLLTLPGSFTNTGTFGIHNDSTLGIGGGFSNSGTLDVDSGYQYYDYSPAYTEGGSSLTITGTLNNTGVVLIGDTSQGLGAATTVTLGGLVNVSGASFSVWGSAGYAVTLNFTEGGSGFSSNGGTFLLYHTFASTLAGDFSNGGTFGIHNGSTFAVSGGFTNSGTLDVDTGYQYYDYSPAYTEGGSNLTVGGTLDNTGVVQIGDTSQGLGAATTMTLGGLVNDVGTSFSAWGSASYMATLIFTNGGSGFTTNGGTFLMYHAGASTLTGSFTNSGTFGLHNGASFAVDGGFANSGTMDVDTGYQYYDYSPAYTEGGSDLTIGGTLNNTGVVQIGDTSLALDAVTTISLGGLVNGAGASFSVYGSAAYAVSLIFTGGGIGFTGNGGTFTLVHVESSAVIGNFVNTGTFGIGDSTTLVIDGNFSNSGGLYVDRSSGMGGSSLTISGTLSNTGSVLVGPANLSLSAATTVSLGGLTNTSAASLSLFGSATYAATMTIAGPASNAASIDIGSYSAFNVTGSNAFTQTAGTTTVNGTFTAPIIDIDGGVLVFNTTDFTNTGTLASADGGLINFGAGGLTNLSANTLTGGTYIVDAGSTLQAPNNTYITTLAADLTLSGAGSVVESLDTATDVQVQIESTLSTITVGGALRVIGGRNYTTANSISDSGSMEVSGGTFQAASMTVSATGSLAIDAGSTLTLSAPLVVDGVLTNAGSINGGGATAVAFGSNTDRLILDPTGSFAGTVAGGGANTTLELAQGTGAGTLNALGTTFTNFGAVIIDAGATWTIDALAAALPGTTLTGNGGSGPLVITTAGSVNLGGVSNFPTIDLAAGSNAVTVTDTTLSGGSVTINGGASGNNSISAAGDTVASKGKTLTYNAGAGTDSFTGGFENDTVTVAAAALASDTFTGGSGTSTLMLTTAGSVDLGGVSNFATIDLAAGTNTVTVTDTTLSGGAVTINGATSGNNTINAASDTAASKGKSLTYNAGSGTDTFTGGFENDTVSVSAAALAGDTFTGGSGSNTLILTSAGSLNLSKVSNFATIDLAAGANTVTVSSAAVSGEALVGGSGPNTLIMSSAGTFSLAGVSGFSTLDLAAGNNTVTITDTTLSGGSLIVDDGAHNTGTTVINASSDTAASKGKSLTLNTGGGVDTFTGGFENDNIHISAAEVSSDVLTGGTGSNTIVVTTAGSVNLGNDRNFGTIDLAAGNNTVTLTDATLSGGSVALHDGASGNNTVSAAGDTAASKGKTLNYYAGSGTDSFTGGFENDTVHVAAASLPGDTLTGGSGSNTLVLTTAGSINLAKLGTFTTIDLAAGTNTVTVSAAAVSNDTIVGSTGSTNTLILSSAGSVNLSGVSRFSTIDLAASNNTITVGDATLSGGSVIINDGAHSTANNTVNASGDTAASKGKSLTENVGSGIDTFTGGFENDAIHISAAAIDTDSLTGGSGANTIVLTTAGSVNLGNVRNFGTIDLAAGNNTVTVTDAALAVGSVALYDGASGNNTVSAAGDTAASAGKTLTYYAKAGSDTFTGGFENDSVHVAAAAVGGDILTGGSGSNALVLTTAGIANLANVSKFATIDLFTGNSTVTLTDTTLSGGSVIINDGASNTGTRTVSAAGDTAASAGKTLTYNVSTGTDHFTGGFENDTMHVAAATIGGDTLTGGSGTNTVVVTTAGSVNLGGVSKFGTIDLAAGNNAVTVTNATLSGGAVALHDGSSGNNTISAAGDTAASAGKTLTYYAGSGADSFTGGFENDTIYAGTGLGTYTAGSGADTFVFVKSSLPDQTLNNFSVTNDDLLVYGKFSTGGFDLGSTDNGLDPTTPTAISASIFVSDATGMFTSSSQRFAYDTTNGQLFYSATGSNTGDVAIATLAGAPSITASNLLFEY